MKKPTLAVSCALLAGASLLPAPALAGLLDDSYDTKGECHHWLSVVVSQERPQVGNKTARSLYTCQKVGDRWYIVPTGV